MVPFGKTRYILIFYVFFFFLQFYDVKASFAKILEFSQTVENLQSGLEGILSHVRVKYLVP